MYARWDSPGLGGAILFPLIYGFICYFTPLMFNFTHAISLGFIGLYFGMVIGIQDDLFFYSYFPLLTFLLLIINTPFSPKDGIVSIAIFIVLFIVGTVLPDNASFKCWIKPEKYCLDKNKLTPNFLMMSKIKGYIFLLSLIIIYLIVIYFS